MDNLAVTCGNEMGTVIEPFSSDHFLSWPSPILVVEGPNITVGERQL